MGTYNGVSEITMDEIILPEFSRTKQVSQPLHANIYDAPKSHYNVIIPCNVLKRLGFDIDFTNQVTTCDGVRLAMRPQDSFSTYKFLSEHLIDIYIYADGPLIGDKFLLESGHAKTDLQGFIEKQTQLMPAHWNNLFEIWSQCTKAFLWKVGPLQR
jgi:hypothetical protein